MDSLSLPVQEQFRRFIKPEINQLSDSLNYKMDFDISRITVWADVDQFKWKEDVYVWNQKKGNMQNIYSVYCDGIFICHIGDNRAYSESLKDFWRGFLKAYSLPDDDPGKLWLDKSIYNEKQKERKQQNNKHDKEIIKAIEDKPVNSETDELAKEIALDVAKETHATTK